MSDCDGCRGFYITCPAGCYSVYNHDTRECTMGCSGSFSEEMNDSHRYSIEVNDFPIGEILRAFGGDVASLAGSDHRRTTSFTLNDARAADIVRRAREALGSRT